MLTIIDTMSLSEPGEGHRLESVHRLMEKELLLQCFDIPDDNLRLDFILLIRRVITLSTGEHSDIIRESHCGDIFRMSCNDNQTENRIVRIDVAYQ